MWNTRLDKVQAEIKIAGRNINNLKYTDDTLMSERKEELKRLLLKWKWRVKKLAYSSTFKKLRSWHPVPSLQANRWGNGGNSGRLYFGGLQNHCTWWLQPRNKKTLLLGRIVMTTVDSMLKSRDITLSTKVCLVKAMVFPVVMYGCESWTVKKAECRRIDAFELWCWKRLLWIPWQQWDAS